MRKVLFGVTVTLIVLISAWAWAEEVDCLMCHPDKAEGKSVHAAVSMGCASCHSGVDASQIPHKMAEGAPKGLSAEGSELCFTCHDSTQFSGQKSVHMPVMGGMCTGCHDPHASGTEKLLISENVCYNCHDQASFSSMKVVHPPVAGGMCTSCHSPHQSEFEKLLVSEMPKVCYDCHDKTKFFAPAVHAPVGLGLCLSCHKPHQSDNNNLLAADRQEICYGCHNKSEFTKAGSIHKPVELGNCLFCHRAHVGQNEALVYRKGNILCRRCHADVERKPHLVSGFQSQGHPLRGRSDPNRPRKTFGCLSCHVPHSSDYPSLYRYKGKSMFELCQYCHEM